MSNVKLFTFHKLCMGTDKHMLYKRLNRRLFVKPRHKRKRTPAETHNIRDHLKIITCLLFFFLT